MGRRYIATRRPLYFASGSAASAGNYDSISTDIKGAYALRKLFSTYSGSAVRVRRSTDNAEQDIGFTSAGDLDTSAFSSFISGGQGFITNWYDQSGNGKDNVQATTTLQPELLLNIQGTRPAAFYTAVNAQRLRDGGAASYWVFLHRTGASIGVVRKVVDSGTQKNMLNTSSGTTTSGLQYQISSTETVALITSRLTGPTTGSSINCTHTTAATYSTATYFHLLDPDNGTAANRCLSWQNEVAMTGANASSSTPDTTEDPASALTIGGRSAGTNCYNGYIFEVLVWGNTYSSYRSTYEASAKAYYGHY